MVTCNAHDLGTPVTFTACHLTLFAASTVIESAASPFPSVCILCEIVSRFWKLVERKVYWYGILKVKCDTNLCKLHDTKRSGQLKDKQKKFIDLF